jgi:amino-acid N-acetyltransferase
MIAEVVMREGEAADLTAVRALLEASNLPTADLTAHHASWFLVAVARDVVVGTGAVEPCGSFGLLRSLAVRPDRRGQGIGRQLVTECEARADEARLRGLYLLTTTARHFFRALGYDELETWELPEAIRETEEYRTLCPETASAMMKRLR